MDSLQIKWVSIYLMGSLMCPTSAEFPGIPYDHFALIHFRIVPVFNPGFEGANYSLNDEFFKRSKYFPLERRSFKFIKNALHDTLNKCELSKSDSKF